MTGAITASMAGCGLLCLTDFANWPVDADGYTIEELPADISASFALGSNVYLGLTTGEIVRADDADPGKPWRSFGRPSDIGARLLFVSASGTVFVSPSGEHMYRTEDGGKTWQVCLDVPVWRMDQDDQGNLYAGNYTKDDEHVATLYRSTDDGVSWSAVFQEDRCHHIHTVRWDDRGDRLYIAFGDGAYRGQAYSDDRGASFERLARGWGQGHTDVAATEHYVIWASDDQSGRVYRVDRRTGRTETLMGRSQFMWFAVSGDRQIYIGTITSRTDGGERGALLASSDEGTTWRKLVETQASSGPYDQGFFAESRNLSVGGWLYCTGDGRSFRVRRNP